MFNLFSMLYKCLSNLLYTKILPALYSLDIPDRAELMNKTTAFISRYIDKTLTRLLPNHCLFCLEKIISSHEQYANIEVCRYCSEQFIHNNHACQRCALPLKHSETHICGNCLSHKYYFEQVYSPFVYTNEIRYLIRQLKYHNKIHYARTLAGLFIQQSKNLEDFRLPQRLIPMPMHKHRLQQRGYNQALELTRSLSRYFHIPVDYQSLIRYRSTGLQAGLNARERQKNVRNAFKITTSAHKSRLSQVPHVALVDDVMTTGSSLNEAARMLKQAGIQRVDGWIIARA